jgi:hypothetical protein
MITRRFVLTGLVAAPAVIAADKLMKAHSMPERYATVYGVGWDLEVIEHPIWQPMSVAHFGGTPAIDQFREVTAFVHAFSTKPMPEPVRLAHWHRDIISDPLSRFRYEVDQFGFLIGPDHDPHGDKPLRYFVCDMEERVRRNRDPNDIWYFDRAAKEDEKPRWAKYDYVNHSRKLGRDEA